MKKVLLFLVLIFSMTQVCFAQNMKGNELINSARKLFNDYKTYSENFDLQLINLYFDDASIEMIRVYQNNESKVLHINGGQLKTLLTQVLPTAKTKGDIDKFYNEKYTILDELTVKIDCTRYSVLREYESPHVMIIKLTENRNFKIIYEKVVQIL